MRCAALVLLLAACGDDRRDASPSPDGPAIDAIDAIDATTPDAPSTIRLVRLRSNAPIENAAVLVVDATGALVARATTDALGRAEVTAVPGANLTVIDPPNGMFTSLVTILDVQPGDDLTIAPQYGDLGPVIGTASIELPGGFPNASGYVIEIGCDAAYLMAPTTYAIDLHATCLTAAGTYEVMALALDDNNATIAFSARHDLVPASGTTSVAMPAWRTDFLDHTVTLANAPARSTGAYVMLAPVHDTVTHVLFSNYAAVSPGGGATIGYALPDYRADLLYTETELAFDGRFPSWSKTAATQIDVGPATPAQTIDLSTLLPRIHDVAATPTSVAWAADADLSAADGQVYWLHWGDGTGRFWSWNLVAPATTASPLALPILPPDFAMHRPPPNAVLDVAMRVFEADFLAGYAAFRSIAGTFAHVPPTYRLRTTYTSDP